jgi:hypothetical protein
LALTSTMTRIVILLLVSNLENGYPFSPLSRRTNGREIDRSGDLFWGHC